MPQINHVLYISLDPAMRGWMNDGRSYVPPVGIGEVMRAGAAGRVIESRNPDFAVGDTVTGLFGVQEYAIADGKAVTKVDTKFAPLPVYLGALGMSGLTAYFGLLETGELKAGETVVISGAAGAVAGQPGLHRDRGFRRSRKTTPGRPEQSLARGERSTPRGHEKPAVPERQLTAGECLITRAHVEQLVGWPWSAQARPLS